MGSFIKIILAETPKAAALLLLIAESVFFLSVAFGGTLLSGAVALLLFYALVLLLFRILRSFIRLRGREGGFFLMVLLAALFILPFGSLATRIFRGVREMRREMVVSDELPVNAAEEKRLIDKLAEIASTASAKRGSNFILRRVEYRKVDNEWRIRVVYIDGDSNYFETSLLQRGDFLRRSSHWCLSSAQRGGEAAKQVLFESIDESFSKFRFSLTRLIDAKPDSNLDVWLAKFAGVFKKKLPRFVDVDSRVPVVELKVKSYIRYMNDEHAEVSADFAVLEKSRVTLDFVYLKGKFHYIRGGVGGWNSGTAHLMCAANSALDAALREMSIGMSADVVARNPSDERGWTKVSAILPALGVRAILLRKSAHPFLAEYYRKIVLRKPGGPEKTFRLSINCGGRTNVRIFTVSKNGVDYLRVKDHADMDVLFRLSDLKLVRTDTVERGRFIGAFMGVTSGLRFVSVDDGNAERLFNAAADRGYPLPLRDYRGLAAEGGAKED